MSTDDRRLFVELADTGSYSATARKLGIARSTVMRRIESLERDLGVTLVHRAGRALALTPAGERLAEGMRGVFRSIERLDQEVRSAEGQPAGVLRLWLPILDTAIIVEELAAFVREYPKVQIRLEQMRDPRRAEVGEFDVMLQMGHRLNPDLHARTLFRDRLILVASPSYLASRTAPETVDALAEHVAIEQVEPTGRVMPWRYPDGTRVPMPPASVSTHVVGYVHEFALHGAGIGRVPRSMARRALKADRLRQVLPEVYVEEPMSLVYLPDPSPTTRAFLDFLSSWEQRRDRRHRGE